MHKTKKKGRTGKNLLFLLLKALKNYILNEKVNPQMTKIRAFFFQSWGTFFQFLKKGMVDLSPLPPLVTRPHLQTSLNFSRLIKITGLPRRVIYGGEMLQVRVNNSELGTFYKSIVSILTTQFRLCRKKPCMVSINSSCYLLLKLDLFIPRP